MLSVVIPIFDVRKRFWTPCTTLTSELDSSVNLGNWFMSMTEQGLLPRKLLQGYQARMRGL